MKYSICAVIAAKDEEKHIGKVVKETKKYVDKVIVVDDGSSDSTALEAEKAGAIVLKHAINLGKGAAIKTGCDFALQNKAKKIILLDADGQHNPSEIPMLLERLSLNDIVLGARKMKKPMPFILKSGNWIINRITYLLYGIDIMDTQCGFRALSSAAYKQLRWKSSDYSMESEMISLIGKKRLKYSQVTVSTIYSDRYKGTTILDGIKIVMNMVWWRLSR
jgi:glycosyltransferase involved in cell wall biosynthesis